MWETLHLLETWFIHCLVMAFDSCELEYCELIQSFYKNNTTSLMFLQKHGILYNEVKCKECGVCLWNEVTSCITE